MKIPQVFTLIQENKRKYMYKKLTPYLKKRRRAGQW